jgi:hypothetical protein
MFSDLSFLLLLSSLFFFFSPLFSGSMCVCVGRSYQADLHSTLTPHLRSRYNPEDCFAHPLSRALISDYSYIGIAIYRWHTHTHTHTTLSSSSSSSSSQVVLDVSTKTTTTKKKVNDHDVRRITRPEQNTPQMILFWTNKTKKKGSRRMERSLHQNIFVVIFFCRVAERDRSHPTSFRKNEKARNVTTPTTTRERRKKTQCEA